MNNERGPFEEFAEGVARHRQAFKSLDFIDQNLTRAGNGLALALALVIIPCAMWGLPLLFAIMRAPKDYAWWLIGWTVLMTIGITRFVIGVSRVAGVRDNARRAKHFGLALLFGGLTVALIIHFPSPDDGKWIFFGAFILFWAFVFEALGEVTKVVVLSLPQRSIELGGGGFQW
jgi:hypothetical protein